MIFIAIITSLSYQCEINFKVSLSVSSFFFFLLTFFCLSLICFGLDYLLKKISPIFFSFSGYFWKWKIFRFWVFAEKQRAGKRLTMNVVISTELNIISGFIFGYCQCMLSVNVTACILGVQEAFITTRHKKQS